MPDSIVEWMRSRAQTPLVIVRVNGTKIEQNILSVDVTMSSEQQSTTANVRFSAEAYPVGWLPHTSLTIRMGFAGEGGGTVLVFDGEIEDIDVSFLPYGFDVKGAGFLKRLQRNAGNTLSSGDPADVNSNPIITWAGVTDSQIWNDVMRLGGVPKYTSGDGDSRTIAGPIELLAGDNLRSIIDQLDQASESGQRTFEFAGHVYRQAALRIPLALPPWSYADGNPTSPTLPLYRLQRQQTDRDVKNQVIIQGTPTDGTPPEDVVGAVRQEPSAYWGTDGNGDTIYVPFNLSSKFLETRDQCDAVAERYMYEHNKITDVVTMRTPLNPYARPAITVGITSDRIDRPSMVPYWVRQVSHHVGQDGASTDWTLEGGGGATGYLVGLPPIALFEMRITQEAYQQGIYDTPTTAYTVACDGSTSYDPDGTTLSYAWSASNGASGTGVTFTTVFSEAQWEDAENPPTITLTVTDSDSPDPHTSAPNEQFVVGSESATEAKVIAMYCAAYNTAYATSDGWGTVNSWSPGGGVHVISVGRIGAEGTNFFGLDNGAVYQTSDYLASTPTLKWTHPSGSACTAVWMSELDTNIVAMGFANGDFYLTTDLFATTPTRTRNFGNAVQWINGSSQSKQQWRALVGQDAWYTDNNFVGARVLVSFAGLTTKQAELTNFANYESAAGSAGSQVLKRESDGFPLAFPSLSPAPAEAHMTAFIDTDTLLVGDDQGRSFISEPASLGTTLVQKANVGYGAVNDMLRDNTNNAAAYAACNTALAKTFDRATSWVRVLTFDGTNTKGLRLGYDSAPLTPPIELLDQLIEVVFQGLHNTTNNFVDYPPGDLPIDNKRVMDLWNPNNPQDGEGARNDTPPTNWHLRSFTPVDYVVGGYTHVWGDGDDIEENPIGGEVQSFDRARGSWIKSFSNDYHTGAPSGWPGQPGPGQHPQWLCRHTFTLPAMTIGRAVLVFHGNTSSVTNDPIGTLMEVWVNDTQVATNWSGLQGIAITPSLLVADGTTNNLIAIRARMDQSNSAPRVAYKLMVGAQSGAATESVSLFENTTTNKLIWGATSEGSVAGYGSLTPLPSNWYAPITDTPIPIGAGVSYGASPSAVHLGMYALPFPDVYHLGSKLGNMLATSAAEPISIYKQAIDMPAGAAAAWKLYVRKFRPEFCQIDDIYINGTRLATSTPASPINDTGNGRIDTGVSISGVSIYYYVFDVPSGTILMGARNTLAIKVQSSFSGSANYKNGIAWYMEQQ